MRRDVKHEILNTFLAFNSALREEVRDIRRLIAARSSEAKYNPNWRLQPRAPRGTVEGGQWTDGGASWRPGRGPKTRATRPRRDHNEPRGSLQEVFPRLVESPVGAVLAPIDGFLGLSGPGLAANEEATRSLSESLIRDIRALDPTYRPPALANGFPRSIEGRNNYLASLRADRAAAIYRIRGDYRPLQVETLRFLQSRVDRAYAEGMRQLRLRRIRIRLSDREALGNHIDRAIRRDARDFFSRLGIRWESDARIRIQRREYDTSGSDRTYRIPDVRIGNVHLDTTIAPKSHRTQQVQGFFNSDSRPDGVIIVRPTQLGGSYYLTRPAAGRN